MAGGIVIEGVSKHFKRYRGRPGSLKEAITAGRRSTSDEFYALHDINLEIPDGSMFALIGHNGSGKSTLLRCIAGIYAPTKGSIRAEGRISALLELGSGFHPDLTGRENIFLNAAIIGMGRREIESKFDDIVEFAGVSQFIDTPVRFYSSGMYVRLGFAVAVHVDPEILIIDEVITVGDEEFQRRCFDHLYELRRSGVTIVVVSHSLGIVQTMCDSAAWLDHGELQMTGPGVEVVESYIHRVNEHERTFARRSGEIAADHFGSGEIVVSRIELVDADGRSSPTATNGEPITIRLHWSSAEGVSDPVFALSVRHENGTVVSSSSTGTSQVVTGRCEGTGYVDWRIEDLPIVAGNYEVWTSILDEHSQHAFFHQDGGVPFAVRAGRRPVVAGLVDLPAEWLIRS